MPSLADQVAYQIQQPTPPDNGIRAATIISVHPNGTVDLKVDNGYGLSTTDVQNVPASTGGISAPQSGAFWYPNGAPPGPLQPWTPAVTASGSMTVTALTSLEPPMYCRIGNLCFIKYSCSFTLGGTASTNVFITLPLPIVGGVSPGHSMSAYFPATGAGTAAVFAACRTTPSNNSLTVYYTTAGNYVLGNYQFSVSGFYQCG